MPKRAGERGWPTAGEPADSRGKRGGECLENSSNAPERPSGDRSGWDVVMDSGTLVDSKWLLLGAVFSSRVASHWDAVEAQYCGRSGRQWQ